MQLSTEEIQNLSNLFLSKDSSNTELAFNIMEPYGFVPELLTEIFIVYKLASSKEEKAIPGDLLKKHASENIHAAMAGRIKLNSENTIKRNIAKYVALSKEELDGIKLGRALYNKYEIGFAYLMKEEGSEEIKALIQSQIQGTHCDLSGKGLKTLPKELFEFVDLEDIDLSGNYIVNITKHFSVFTKLRKLDLSNNSLKKMHAALSSLQKLEELNLNNNLFTEIPPVLSSFKKLRRLSMIWMFSMKEFGDRAALPPNFAQLNLQYLALAQKNTSRYQYDFDLPQVSILEATGDQYLDLTPLGLAKHSFEMGETTAIRYLLLKAETDYRKKVLASIYDAKTKSIDFSGLGIYAIPEELSAFDLRTLNLNDTRLGYNLRDDYDVNTIFKPIGNLTLLEHLNLNYNGLEEIPEAVFKCKNLRKLSLDGNKITFVPTDIAKLQELEDLSIRSSEYSKALTLPDEMSTLTKLQTINTMPMYQTSQEVMDQTIQRLKELFGARISFSTRS